MEADDAFRLWKEKFSGSRKLAEEQGYSFLIQGEVGALPELDGSRYKGAPWFHRVTFPAAGFPGRCGSHQQEDLGPSGEGQGGVGPPHRP